MEKERLTSVYNRICDFNRSACKDTEEAKSIKAEVYDICMAEDANSENFENKPGGEIFGSARTIMQLVFNALSEDVSASEYIESQWNGFHFAEKQMKSGFENNSFDERWDWDEWFKNFEEKFRIEDTEAYIASVYQKYVEDYPWLDAVQMSDEELAVRLTRDVGIRTSNYWLNNGYNKPYDRICINILKSVYETGEHRIVHDGYIDGQLEDVILTIKAKMNC